MKCLIYDFETLAQSPSECAVVCLAVLEFDLNEMRSRSVYRYEDLKPQVKLYKFDVEDQVKNYDNFKINKSTLEWWKDKGPVAKALLVPTANDIKIGELVDRMKSDGFFKSEYRYVFTRGNTFDPVILERILSTTKQGSLYPWWSIRDTRSYIDGIFDYAGVKSRNDFAVPGMKKVCDEDKHNPVVDVCLDVLRLQYLFDVADDRAEEDYCEESIPF